MAAVALAVAALTAVGFFADRLQSGLARDARQLLGGDAVVVADNPLPPEFEARAQAQGLRLAHTLSFPTMARAPDERGGASQLVTLKAVEASYPLRGQLTLSAAADGSAPETRRGATGTAATGAAVPTGKGAVAAAAPADGLAQPTLPTGDGAPERGEAWVDANLLDGLGLALGDALLLGDARLRVTRVIVKEPDRGTGFLSFSPRVMLNLADMPATGLIQPASRVTYRLAVAGQDGAGNAGDAAVARFTGWVQQQVDERSVRGLRVDTLDAGRPEMERTLGRADKFLSLVALLAAMLSAVAVALAARGFAARQLDHCAMLRVLGQSQRRIAGAYVVEFVLAGLAGSLVGVLLGWLVHLGFVQLLAGLVAVELPPVGAWPALLGLGVGLTLLVAFGLPPVLQLARVPPLRVLRRDVGQLKPASLAVLGLGVLGFAALLLVVSADLKLGLIAVGGFAGAVAVFAVLSWLAVWVLRRTVNERTAPSWLVLATRQISARPAYAVVQVSSLAVGLLALVLLVLLRTDLIAGWREATPPDAPNRFVINVMPDQAEAFQARLRDAGVQQFDWYPMFRGRLVQVNDRAVTPDDYAEERAKRLVDREFNLSNSAQVPSHNPVVAGAWVDEEPGAISVEEGLATTLGLKLGDVLHFDVGGLPLQGRITSLRKVEWGSMHANFFVLFPHAQMRISLAEGSAGVVSAGGGAPANDADSVDLPITYMAAYRAPEAGTPQAQGFDNALVRAFPNVTNVNLTATLAQVQGVLDQVIGAVQLLFAFTLAAGLIVLFAAVTATREDRAREFAIMRAVGASARLLARVQRAELLGVGLLAGFLASCVALGVGWALARYAFEFSWTPVPWVPLAGAGAGALLAWLAGWIGLRQVLTRPVMQSLRAVT
ncbi:ABC transporter permease [Comamonas serinivorans]|uniref:ABC transporter permease n=2 Tax=Comamonas serinivorans TaxID=1082851 RepID=A0A1Y0ETN1_9BURK|nr:ABC transporter permease [Comamonas serinivorans]